MNKHTQSQSIRQALAAAVLLTGAGCAMPQSGPSIPPVSTGAIPSAPFNSKAARAGISPSGQPSAPFTYIQFANGTGQTIYPQLTQPWGWISDHPPRPIPPGRKDLPIILGCNANGVIPDYEVLYGPADPPNTGPVFKAHFNPGAAHPYAFEPDGGDGLQMTLKDHVTLGGVHITVITVTPATPTKS